MHCEWEPFEGEFKCKYCNFTIKDNSFKKRCKKHPETIDRKTHELKTDAPPKAPGLLTRAKNFAKAATHHIMTGRKHCTDEQKQARFDQCTKNECGLFIVHGEGGVCAHEKCGCFIRAQGQFMDKLSWADSECPLGYWKAIAEKDGETPENGV